MPRFDRTGPYGEGPRTGRGFGPCGFGFGWRNRSNAGRGMGGYSDGWNLPQTKSDQKKYLADYRKVLEEELKEIGKEEKELSKEE